VVEVFADNPFQGGMDLGEQPPQPVRRGGDLGGEVLVEAAQQRELGGLPVLEVDRPEGARHGAGGLSDDGGVAGVGLGLAGVEVRHPAHGQAGQVGDLGAGVQADRDGQRPDRRGLVDDQQHPPALGQLGDDRAELRLVVRQRLVEEFGSVFVERDGVV
jgi:hypothetical protein